MVLFSLAALGPSNRNHVVKRVYKPRENAGTGEGILG